MAYFVSHPVAERQQQLGDNNCFLIDKQQKYLHNLNHKAMIVVLEFAALLAVILLPLVPAKKAAKN